MLDVRWLIAVFIDGSILATMSTAFTLMVSFRVSDPGVAEQISMTVIVPVLIGLFSQTVGLFVLNSQIISIISITTLALDAILICLIVPFFQRELSLT